MVDAFKKLSLSYDWKNIFLLQQALTHKSYHFEKIATSYGHNEKLEFIGDAVIDVVLSELLFDRFPDDEEGGLSKKRASLVNEEVLATLALKIGLSELLQLGKGEKKTEGNKKPRLLASAYEAIIGAIYLDGGFDQARVILLNHFGPLVEALDPSEDYLHDYKTRVQELAQKIFKVTPHYEVLVQEGPSHNPVFKVALYLGTVRVSEGEGSNKKQAEQQAAKHALDGGLDGLKL